MDYTIFYVLGIVAFAVGLAIGTKFLNTKGIISNEQLLFVAKIFDLTIKIVDELNLKNEKQIMTIANIVYDSIEYIIAINEEPDKMVENAYAYAVDKCMLFGIELTGNRQAILLQLITMGLNNKIADEVIV